MRRHARFGRLRRSAGNERGAVLVIVAIVLPFVLFGFAALAIDIGTFSQQQRQAQAAADSAALAAAQDLPGSATNAIADAKSYVTKNMPTVPATYTVTPTACPSPITPGVCIQTPYNSNSKQIQVTVTLTVNSLFGHVFGITSTKVSASAVAAATPGTGVSCGTPGNTCDAIFSMNSSCSGPGVVFGGGTTISGAVASNGALNVGGGGSTYGATTYGSGCTVQPSGYGSQGNTFTSGPTATAPTLTWPIDYSLDFPACAGAACTGPLGTPSFCTQASTATTWTLVSYSPFTLTSNNIYCGVGTGTPSTPSSWNGTISASESGSGTIESSYVAGSVTIGGGSDLEACGYRVANLGGYNAAGCSAGVPAPTTTNYPLAYAVGTGSAFTDAGGAGNFLGDVFVPNGNISFGGGGNTVTFLEAQNVNISAGGDNGDGPTSSGGSGTTSGGSTALLQ